LKKENKERSPEECYEEHANSAHNHRQVFCNNKIETNIKSIETINTKIESNNTATSLHEEHNYQIKAYNYLADQKINNQITNFNHR